MPEKFDFSKIEDQKKFDELPKEEQKEIVGEAYDEAEKIRSKADYLVLNTAQKKSTGKEFRKADLNLRRSGKLNPINWEKKEATKKIKFLIIFGFDTQNIVFKNYMEKVKSLYEELAAVLVEKSKAVHLYYEIENICYILGLDFPKEKYISSATEQYSGVENFPCRVENYCIPIILNHPKIKPLRWCYASYASIPTHKGWNIIEMETKNKGK